MKTSTSRGHRCICQATIQLAETGLFREFQYLTVPLHLVPTSWDRARTVLDDARRAGRHQPPNPETHTETRPAGGPADGN
jgi:hypothetical protein